MEFDIGLDNMIERATRMGKELSELDKINRERKQRGLPALPDPQDLKDQDISIHRKYRVAKTVSAEEAIAALRAPVADPVMPPEPPAPKKSTQKGRRKPSKKPEAASDEAAAGNSEPTSPSTGGMAARQAEAARMVEDMKNGRINHIGNWAQVGVDMGLEGGSKTTLFRPGQLKEIVEGAQDPSTSAGDFHPKGMDSRTAPDDPAQKTLEIPMGAPYPEMPVGVLPALFQDLYNKLGTSFDGLETTLSDLQGKVNVITDAYKEFYGKPPAGYADEGYEQFKGAMSGKTKVTYNINGTKISFDAVKVYLEPPCLVIVTKDDTAAVRPKPGSKLYITYDLDGVSYQNDLVTFLGISFAIPELGMRFSGFVRDADAELFDAEAEA